MTPTARFGESSAQQPSVLLDAPQPSLALYDGSLGNRHAQTPFLQPEFEGENWLLLTSIKARFGAAPPESKLAILKRHKFTPEGREHRVAASLAALEAPQSILLTREQWKEIVEEVEDEDED